MIKVHTWPTPNCHKVYLVLDECDLKLNRHFEAIPVNIGNSDPFNPEFLAVRPNNKIPASMDPVGPDRTPITMFEFAAI